MLRVRPIGPACSPGQYIYDAASSSSTSFPSSSSSSTPARPFASSSSSSSSSNPLHRNVRGTADGSEEVMIWYGRRVVWSRGAEIHRQWTFEGSGQEDEQVTWAGFVLFPPQSLSPQPSQDDLETAEGSTTRSKAETFGPFHTSQHATWGRPSPSPSGSSSSTSSNASKADVSLVQTVLICLRSKAVVYYPSGETHTFHIPFLVHSAFALPSPRGGVLLQRQLEKRERRRLEGRSAPNSSLLRGMETGMVSVLDEIDALDQGGPPRVYTLSNPFDELKPVVQADLTDGKIAGLELTIDFEVEILHLDETYPFVVAYNSLENEVIVYERHVVPLPPASTPPPSSRQGPQDLLAPQHPATASKANTTATAAGLGHGRPSLARTNTHLTGTERRVSSIASEAMDRTRRGPRVSRGGHVEPQHLAPSTRPGELQAALDPPSLPAPTPPSANRGKGKARARVSIAPPLEGKTRRQSALALANASLIREEEVIRPVLLGAAERDLRETTMMMGLEKEASLSRSELVLEPLWHWSPPSGIDMHSAHVFLSNDISSDKVDINIHASSSLFTFSAHRGDGWTFTPLPPIPCKTAVAVHSTRANVHDTLLLLNDGSLQISASGRTIPLSLPRSLVEVRDELPRQLASRLSMALDTDEEMGESKSRQIIRMRDAVQSRVTIDFEDGESVRVSVDYRFKDDLVRRCFDAITWLVPPEVAHRIQLASWQHLSPSVSGSDQWHALDKAVKLVLGISESTSDQSTSFYVQAYTSDDPITRKLAARARSSATHQSPTSSTPTRPPSGARPNTGAHILLALHLVAQDCQLSQSRQSELSLVAQLVVDLASALGSQDWVDYWKRCMPLCSDQQAVKLNDQDTTVLDAFDAPPDILQYLSRRLSTPLKPFPSLHTLNPHTPDNGRTSPCSATSRIISIYDRLCVSSDPPTDARSRAESIINRTGDTASFMSSLDLGHSYLYDLPLCIAMPIMESLKVCQMVPRKDWSAAVYDIIGRTDLAVRARGGVLTPRDGTGITDQDVPTVATILSSLAEDKAKHTHGLPSLPHVRFGSDRRLAEVERIMQTTQVRTIAIQEPKNANDSDISQYQQSFVNVIAHRTLSLPVGQGIFEYGTRSTTITDAFEIPLIELSVKVVPGNTTLSAQIVAEHADWPCFHNGVASALSISPDCPGIDSSWIVFNRPSNLNPEHGGFLLGLGLTGHLRSLMTYHAFPYMEPRHDFTSVGLLLGLAASFAGSEDLLITKVLSLHTHALLPLGSMELNASAVIQSTALVGLGLVYAGSRNLRMAETALGELGRKEMGGVDGFNEYAEAYSFSAAMAFGLIMLGRGGQITSEVDRRMLSKLTKCIHGSPASVDARHPQVDTTITAPGATLALGLMYLKTGRGDVADILTIPDSAFALEHVRPDLLLLRTFARALIMWDQVAPSMAWIEAQIPSFIQHKGHRRTAQLELNTELAYINIVAGACLAIALKYAGTAGEVAHNSLTFFYSVLSKASAVQSMTYEGKIRRTAARQGLNVVTIALAVVMSGTGELNVLRRLRIAHGQEGSGVTYGTHMAMHMAVGILFLGRGHYTLGNSNLAIAAMSIAFFPRFLSSPSDNKAYPQAFRHLWALAVEPRCLIARDVDTAETIYLPVKVKLNENGQVRYQSLISPTLIAPFESLLSIEVDSPRYWPITYDLSDPRDRAALVRTRTIYVKRKAGFLDYNSDPKGNRSIFVRAGSMTGFDLHYDLVSTSAPPIVSADEVVQLMQAHCDDPTLISMAKHLNGDTAFERAVRVVLLECVSLDKPSMIPIYISLLLSLSPSGGSAHRMETIVGLGLLRRFYAASFERDYSLPARERQGPLIRGNTLSTIERLLIDGPGRLRGSEKSHHQSGAEAYFAHAAWPRGEEAMEFAVYLFKNHVPLLPALVALAERTASAGGEASGREDILKVRDVAKAYARALEERWDLTPPSTVQSVPVWKWDSAVEAVQVWSRSVSSSSS